MALAFGDVGKAAAVVVMVIQIAGSGGTYPIETLPEIYQKIYIFFPFPYAINAMRETIGGMCCGSMCLPTASTKRVWTEPNPDGTHRIERAENVKDVAQYIARIDEMIQRKQKLFAEE